MKVETAPSSRGPVQSYAEFLEGKRQLSQMHGFEPIWLSDALFDFQKALVEWAIRKGRAAIFADCGLGKTLMQLVWAENVTRKTHRPVLILTPLAVTRQTIREAEKFSIRAECANDSERISEGNGGIFVTNYEKLHRFDSSKFSGCVCDESSILKSFDGARRNEITAFMRKLPYRLLCTATAAPNDYIELGTSSEALGELGHIDMLNRFFKNDHNTTDLKRHWRLDGRVNRWRFKGHAEEPFWRWVASWARALRTPADIGFEDKRFVLPPLTEVEHIVKSRRLRPGTLFEMPAIGLREEREERRRTIQERCEKMAELILAHDRPAIAWCHMNAEGDLLEKLIPGSVQVSGRDDDEEKERKFTAFLDGTARVLISKPKIGAWGLNFQHCAHIVTFASHSFEQYYQSVRRCWRFGQSNPVVVDIVATQAEAGIRANLQAKSQAAEKMFRALVAYMNHALRIEDKREFTKLVEVPTWL